MISQGLLCMQKIMIYIFNSNNADMAVLLVSCLGGTSKIADVKFDNKINELTDDYVPFTK